MIISAGFATDTCLLFSIYFNKIYTLTGEVYCVIVMSERRCIHVNYL